MHALSRAARLEPRHHVPAGEFVAIARRLRGITGDVFGAAIEVAELAMLLAVLQQRARISASLSHGNIAQVYDLDIDEDQLREENLRAMDESKQKAIGVAFEALGVDAITGSGIEVGGPAEPYEIGTMARINQVQPAPGGRLHILAIGDGPETDIRGAADYGLDAVLVAEGVTDASEGLHVAEAEVLKAVPHARIVATVHDLSWV